MYHTQKTIKHLEDLDIFRLLHLCDMSKAQRQLMVLSAYFSRDAFKIYTSSITMQRYNSMLSSSIILIFQSLIIHTDNLMIFLEDSRLMETMYILFSYLIWKMAAYINIHYLACSRHPTLAFVGKKKKKVSFFWPTCITVEWLEGTVWREKYLVTTQLPQDECPNMAILWNVFLCFPNSQLYLVLTA